MQGTFSSPKRPRTAILSSKPLTDTATEPSLTNSTNNSRDSDALPPSCTPTNCQTDINHAVGSSIIIDTSAQGVDTPQVPPANVRQLQNNSSKRTSMLDYSRSFGTRSSLPFVNAGIEVSNKGETSVVRCKIRDSLRSNSDIIEADEIPDSSVACKEGSNLSPLQNWAYASQKYVPVFNKNTFPTDIRFSDKRISCLKYSNSFSSKCGVSNQLRLAPLPTLISNSNVLPKTAHNSSTIPFSIAALCARDEARFITSHSDTSFLNLYKAGCSKSNHTDCGSGRSCKLQFGVTNSHIGLRPSLSCPIPIG